MRMFWQLEEHEQDDAEGYFVDSLIHEWLEEGFTYERIDPTEEDTATKAEIDKLLEHARTLENCGERFDYLLSNEIFGGVVWDIAIDLASKTYYLDCNENSLYPHHLSGEHDEDEETEVGDEDIIDESLPEIVPPAKKISNLN